MNYQITKEQLTNILEGCHARSYIGIFNNNEPDETYDKLMNELIGDEFYELDDIYMFENTADFYLYFYCDIMTEEFSKFIEEKKELLKSNK